MKVLVRWDGIRWRAIGDGAFHGFGKSLPTAIDDLDRSIDAGIAYRGVESSVKTESREIEIVLDPSIAESVARRARALAELRRAEKALEDRTVESIDALLRVGIGMRDAGQIVGLSRSSVHRIAKPAAPLALDERRT